MNGRYHIVMMLGVMLLVAGCTDAPSGPGTPAAGSAPAAAPVNANDVKDVLRALEQVALATAPREAPAEGYVYRRSESDVGVVEEWAEIQGLIPVKYRQDGKDVDSRPSTAEAAQSMRSRLAADGPSVELPTPAWLAALPGDAEALKAKLAAGRSDVLPAELAGMMFTRADPLLPAKLRAALIRLIATTPGLSSSERTVGGKRCFVLRYPAYRATYELIIDDHAHGAGSSVHGGPASPGPKGELPGTESSRWTFDVRKDLS
jgi:hypothetical protein